ncbi:unnamed protein product [Sympodiomycopsis kandeliae]
MASSTRSGLYLGTLASTLLFSVLTIVLLFIPYPSHTVHFNLVKSTRIPSPEGQYSTESQYGTEGQYVTTEYQYTRSPVPYLETIRFNDGTDRIYQQTSYSDLYYLTTYTTRSGGPYGSYQTGRAAYDTVGLRDLSTSTVSSAMATVQVAGGQASVRSIFQEVASTDWSSSRIPVPSHPSHLPNPTPAPQKHARQASSSVSNVGSATSSALPLSTTVPLEAISVGPLVIVWLLITCAIFILIAFSLGFWFFWQRSSRQDEEGNDGAMEMMLPPEMQQLQAQTPQALSESQRDPPSTPTDQTANSCPRRQKIPIRGARIHACGLFTFGILMLLPLGLMMYAAVHFGKARYGYYDVGGISTPNGYGSVGTNSNDGCLPLDGSAISSSYSSDHGDGIHGETCPAGEGMYTLSGGVSLARFGPQVVLVLVFGWLVFVAVMVLGVIVCLNRGESRKQRKKRKSAEEQRRIMVEAWTAGYRAQRQTHSDSANAAMEGEPWVQVSHGQAQYRPELQAPTSSRKN